MLWCPFPMAIIRGLKWKSIECPFTLALCVSSNNFTISDLPWYTARCKAVHSSFKILGGLAIVLGNNCDSKYACMKSRWQAPPEFKVSVNKSVLFVHTATYRGFPIFLDASMQWGLRRSGKEVAIVPVRQQVMKHCARLAVIYQCMSVDRLGLVWNMFRERRKRVLTCIEKWCAVQTCLFMNACGQAWTCLIHFQRKKKMYQLEQTSTDKSFSMTTGWLFLRTLQIQTRLSIDLNTGAVVYCSCGCPGVCYILSYTRIQLLRYRNITPPLGTKYTKCHIVFQVYPLVDKHKFMLNTFTTANPHLTFLVIKKRSFNQAFSSCHWQIEHHRKP